MTVLGIIWESFALLFLLTVIAVPVGRHLRKISDQYPVPPEPEHSHVRVVNKP